MNRELTARETEILHHLALSGMENKAVGRELGISHKTVEAHRANIMWKLSITRAAELTRYVYALYYAPSRTIPTSVEGSPVQY